MTNYEPPFTITNKMLKLVSQIMEKIGKFDNYNNLVKKPILRKNNRINSIHSSLAIEANSLSYNQVRDVIDGHDVMGPPREIQEVKNAYEAYEQFANVDPFSVNDLKRIQGIMLHYLVDDAGQFRKTGEGVFDGDKCIFVAPPAHMVNTLVNNLFDYLTKERDNINMLILSSLFHYEFVFIHPFSDGNGRMARLWQNILLYRYKSLFEYLPIESKIKDYQEDYYAAIAFCNEAGNANVFIEFMLEMIDKTLEEQLTNNKFEGKVDERTINLNKILDVMEKNDPMSAYEIMNKLNIKSKETFRNNYLNPALESGLIKMVIPDKPTSKNQMYYKI